MLGAVVIVRAVRHVRVRRWCSGSEGSLPAIAAGTATAIALLLLAGAVGKSAQVPLHVWLPDAMAGPTPVSALIHAATMVTAGVYLVVRMHVIFEISGVALTVVADRRARRRAVRGDWPRSGRTTSSVPRLLHDVSQLGFMFLAAGMRALRGRDLHAGRARVLQGVDVPRRGHRDARHARRDRHAADGRAAAGNAVDRGAVRGRRARRCRASPFAGSSRRTTILEIASHDGGRGVYVLGSVGALLSALVHPPAVLPRVLRRRERYEGHAHESPPLMTRAAASCSRSGGLFVGPRGCASKPEGRLATFLEPVVGPSARAPRDRRPRC